MCCLLVFYFLIFFSFLYVLKIRLCYAKAQENLLARSLCSSELLNHKLYKLCCWYCQWTAFDCDFFFFSLWTVHANRSPAGLQTVDWLIFLMCSKINLKDPHSRHRCYIFTPQLLSSSSTPSCLCRGTVGLRLNTFPGGHHNKNI